MADEHKIIGVCGIISVGVGTANSIFKHKRMPSSRFLIGSGVAFLALSALAEGQPELAKGLATGVMTTVLLGEGGGVLSYIDHGEMDTKKSDKPDPTPAQDYPPDPSETGAMAGQFVGVMLQAPGGQFRTDTLPPIPGVSPRRPIIVNHR